MKTDLSNVQRKRKPPALRVRRSAMSGGSHRNELSTRPRP
jgi:hypothetical protein